MAFLVSPGVEVKEIDATNVIPAVSTSIGGTAGYFGWGPVGKLISVSSEKELASIFGKPTAASSQYFLPAAGFLKYGQQLKVSRAAPSTSKNAASGTEILIKNRDALETSTLSSAGDFVARYPGALGNSIIVSQCTGAQYAAWAYKGQFDSAPGTSPWAGAIESSAIDEASGVTAYKDEIHIIVIDSTGDISGVKGTILEKFSHLSQATNAKTVSGSTNYFKDVINNSSEWIYVGNVAARAGGAYSPPKAIAGGATTVFLDPTGASSSSSTPLTAFTTLLSGGVSLETFVAADMEAALELLADVETVDVNLLFAAGDVGAAAVAVNSKLKTIAVSRKDCVAFVSPPIALTDGTTSTSNTAAVVTYMSSTLNANSSYCVADSSALYVYDKYHDTYRYIQACGHIAGLCANTDRVADAWFSPAGETRGQLLGVVKLGLNPTQTNRDDLYKAGVNPLVSLPGRGTMLFGDKTTQNRASAFDRINVRRLFIVLEKAISTASQSILFEFNDEFTRANFRNMVEPFLRDVKGRRGITDFLVICDETNNPGNVVDSNRFVADIYIKPARSINFITLNFVATRTGVEFSEIAGQ
jgi:hypothetical protein